MKQRYARECPGECLAHSWRSGNAAATIISPQFPHLTELREKCVPAETSSLWEGGQGGPQRSRIFNPQTQALASHLLLPISDPKVLIHLHLADAGPLESAHLSGLPEATPRAETPTPSIPGGNSPRHPWALGLSTNKEMLMSRLLHRSRMCSKDVTSEHLASVS